MADTNFIAKLAKLTNMDKEAVLSRLEELDVNDAMAALDAAGSGNATTAKRLMSGTTTDEDDERDEKDLEAEINPLFMSKPIEAPNDELPVEDKDFGKTEIFPNVGDSVLVLTNVDGKAVVRRGNVKIPDGPRNTVGVMIDGKLKMEKRRNLKMEESVMGMTMMPDLTRMRELAGIMSSSMPTETTPEVADNAMGSLDVPSIEIEVETENAHSTECPLATTEPVPAHCHAETPTMCIDAVMASFDQIEQALPELKVKDAREIRKRVNDLMSKLNESRFRKI